MPTKTKIEWCDYVTNPVRAFVSNDMKKDGYACVRKSEGCAHCWASTFNVRLGTGLEYTLPNLRDVTVYIKGKELTAIEKFRPHGSFKNGRDRALMFPCDMTDLFGEWMDNIMIHQVFSAMAQNEDVDWLILTKRPERAMGWLDVWVHRNMKVPEHVIIGCSVENEQRARERFMSMLTIDRMGFRTAVSYEPALGMVNWSDWEFLDWMICGGESGNQARPMAPNWARSARDFCQIYDIPFFFKQWGEWAPVKDLVKRGMTTFRNRPVEMAGEMMVKIGKWLAGHLLDEQEWRQVP